MHHLKNIRENIKKQCVDAYVQPVHDTFLSEYPPACNRRVEWLCGFSGSAGAVAITQNQAALFTDGRYTLQAQQQVDTNLYEQHNSGTLMAEAWLAHVLPAGSRVGYDAMLFTRDMLARMRRELEPKQISLVSVENAVDAVWADRPAAPGSAVFVHDLAYAGVASAEKRAQVAGALADHTADVLLVSAPEAVCWLLNIRGRDVQNTPLLLAVALVDAHGHVELFVELERCNAEVREYLGDEVKLVAPQHLRARLAGLSGKKVMCDPAQVPVWYTQQLEEAGAQLVYAADPCHLAKAIKNVTEVEGIRAAHIRDGLAVVRLLAWLDAEVASKHQLSELQVVAKLLEMRAQQGHFLEPSFDTIAGSGPNGAIVHYRATEESNRLLQEGELFLLDSGGQYPDGTTDITRTVSVGVPTPEMCDRFTRVLKGHIALATAKFPQGTCGSQLDALARQYLWEAELDYDHGTGHGVGCFLGVHEGPQRISKRGGDAALRVGMVVSNEPGYYKTGAYGIRIENLVTVVDSRVDGSGRHWLAFDTLTCVPIDTRLVSAALLTAAERQWLNAYHHWVEHMLSPQLEAGDRAWLQRACKAI